MSKSVLIINTPYTCYECPCYSNAGCAALRFKEYQGQENCPLKSLPEKKLVNPMDTTGAVAVKFGWNNCLDEILKEKVYE